MITELLRHGANQYGTNSSSAKNTRNRDNKINELYAAKELGGILLVWSEQQRCLQRQTLAVFVFFLAFLFAVRLNQGSGILWENLALEIRVWKFYEI